MNLLAKRLSSGNDSWSTPMHIYEDLNNEFSFDYDPCPLNTYPKLTNTLFDCEDDRKVFNMDRDWENSLFKSS